MVGDDNVRLEPCNQPEDSETGLEAPKVAFSLWEDREDLVDYGPQRFESREGSVPGRSKSKYRISVFQSRV